MIGVSGFVLAGECAMVFESVEKKKISGTMSISFLRQLSRLTMGREIVFGGDDDRVKIARTHLCR